MAFEAKGRIVVALVCAAALAGCSRPSAEKVYGKMHAAACAEDRFVDDVAKDAWQKDITDRGNGSEICGWSFVAVEKAGERQRVDHRGARDVRRCRLDRGRGPKRRQDAQEQFGARGRRESHYRLMNKTSKEQMLLDRPKLVDEKGREFGPVDMESFYVPPKGKTIGLDTLQPSIAKEYWTVIEVPADATRLKFRVHGFDLVGPTKTIDVGL